MKRFFALLLWILIPLVSHAEVLLIPFMSGSDQKADIPTVMWSKPEAVATLIFIPGGSGSFGLTKRPSPRPTWLLAALRASETTPMNLVFMDSHDTLQLDHGTPHARWAPRREAAHIERIRQTIAYYKQLLGKPIFLLGHSNGSLSIAEWLKRTPDPQNSVAGFILSGSRNETEIRQPFAVPVLVLHHRSDPNRWTSPADAERLFASIQKINRSLTHQAWVEGGSDVSGGDPTHSGRHMYHDALPEAAERVRAFMEQVLQK